MGKNKSEVIYIYIYSFFWKIQKKKKGLVRLMILIISGKKSRAKSKDLRKTLGRLKILEMANNSNTLSSSNDCFSSEIVASKIYGLPAAANNAQSNQAVLKSLRAFRPNAHKTKGDELVESVNENCYNSNTLGGKMILNNKNTVFDCNDNKFITQNERFSFGGKDMELHFRTGGVQTKKYNDMIRTIKEDLISVSNIPNVTNNATVNVVHVHDSQGVEGSQNVQSSAVTTQTTTVTSSTVSRSTTLTSSTSKPKTEGESQGSRKPPTSSQPLNQNAIVNYLSTPVTTNASVLSSALTRVTPISRSGTTYVTTNQILSATGARPGGSKIIGQPQYMAIVNRTSLNQSNLPGPAQNTDCQNTTNSVVGFITTSNSLKNSTQSFTITQPARAPVQTARVVTVPGVDATRVVVESDRPNVILGKSFGVQNIRDGMTPVFNHVTTGSNSVTQVRKIEESNSNVTRSNAALNSTPDVSVQGVSNSRSSLENSNLTQSNIPSKVDATKTKPSNETTMLSVISGSNVNYINTSKTNTLRIASDGDGHFLTRNNTVAKNSVVTNLLTNQVPQTFRVNNAKAPHTVILQKNLPERTNRNTLVSDASSTKRNVSVVKAQTTNNSTEKVVIEQEDVSTHPAFINSVSGVAPITLELKNVGPVGTPTTNAFNNRSYISSNAISSNKLPFNEVVRIVPSGSGLNQSAQSLENVELNTSTAATRQNSIGESSDVIAIINSSPSVKLDSSSVMPNRNILATVLKRNPMGNVLSPITSSTSQYLVPNSRNSIHVSNQGDGVQNVMISQNSNSSTIHYTVVNPLQQDIQPGNASSSSNDMMAKENNFETPQTVISSLLNQMENSDFSGESLPAGVGTNNGNNTESPQDLNAGNQQQIGLENKIKMNKSNSSPSTVQTESAFIKKQVLNNQKITILVQNNEGDGEKSDNASTNKFNELLFRDDQKTCITFRAIKRTINDENGSDESPPPPPAKKKNGSSDSLNNGSNGDSPHQSPANSSHSDNNNKTDEKDLKGFKRGGKVLNIKNLIRSPILLLLEKETKENKLE
mgnify:FL=1